MPTGSRPAQAMRIARALGCDAAQLFVTNPRAWHAPEPRPKDEAEVRAAASDCDLTPLVVHATYLINLASQRDDIVRNSITLLAATLDRARRYGASSVVFHIGSAGTAGEDVGIERLVAGLRQTLIADQAAYPHADQPAPLLLLENDVGGGGKLGARFENLAATLDRLPEFADRLGVCLDTAHLWGAGFDISSAEGVSATLAAADRTLGLARVNVLHVNDTPKALGSHLDHHARLGEGVIPLAGLRAFLRAPALAHTTALLETPIAQLPDGQPDWPADRAHLLHARDLAGLPPASFTNGAPLDAIPSATLTIPGSPLDNAC